MNKENCESKEVGGADVDEILPEYDFSRAQPNKYASLYSAGSIEVTELSLDYEIPDDAGNSFLLLPVSIKRTLNDQEYVVYASSTTSVLKLFESNSIPVRLAISESTRIAYLENRSSDWFGPTVLITSALLSQNPSLVSVAINIISSYLYDIFKGKTADPSIRCTFAYLGKGKKKRVHYEGPVSGLSKIPEIIKELEYGPNNIPGGR